MAPKRFANFNSGPHNEITVHNGLGESVLASSERGRICLSVVYYMLGQALNRSIVIRKQQKSFFFIHCINLKSDDVSYLIDNNSKKRKIHTYQFNTNKKGKEILIGFTPHVFRLNVCFIIMYSYDLHVFPFVLVNAYYEHYSTT